MRSNTLKKDLTSGSIAVQLLGFIGPLFLSNVLQTIYNVVDMAVVGHYVGNVGLSAVSVCGDLVNVLTFIAIGFSSAGQVLISQYTGANRMDKTQKLIGTLFSVLFILALVLSVITIVFRKDFLNFTNVPNEARLDALAYFTICAFGFVFTYGYNVVSAILRGMGDSRHPFMFIALASVLNIILDIVFVAGIGMGAGGAALATVISQAVSFVTSMVFLVANKEAFGFDFRVESFAVSKEALVPLIKLGIPIALQFGFIQGSKVFITRWINDYGVNVSAISGIGSKINSIGLTFAGAVGTSSGAMIGQCIGAKKYERVKKTMCISGALSVSIASVLVLTLALFPKAVFGIFTQDTAVLNMVGTYLPVVIVMLYSSAFRAPMNGLINGSGQSRMNFLLAILDGIVGHIGLAALLGFGFGLGLEGLWYGNAAAGFIPVFVGLIFFLSGKWRSEKSWAEK